jgi:hypothetical protein
LAGLNGLLIDDLSASITCGVTGGDSLSLSFNSLTLNCPSLFAVFRFSASLKTVGHEIGCKLLPYRGIVIHNQKDLANTRILGSLSISTASLLRGLASPLFSGDTAS